MLLHLSANYWHFSVNWWLELVTICENVINAIFLLINGISGLFEVSAISWTLAPLFHVEVLQQIQENTKSFSNNAIFRISIKISTPAISKFKQLKILSFWIDKWNFEMLKLWKLWNWKLGDFESLKFWKFEMKTFWNWRTH